MPIALVGEPVFQVPAVLRAGSLLSGLAPSYPVLISARFLAGLGIGAEFPVAFALLAALTPRKWRSKFIPLGPIMYGVGFIVAGLASIFIILPYSWRWGFLLGVLPALMIIYVRRSCRSRYASWCKRAAWTRQRVSCSASRRAPAKLSQTQSPRAVR